MAISRDLPSKTLEELLSEVGVSTPEKDALLGSAQVLPPVGQTLTELDTAASDDWVEFSISPAEDPDE